MTLAGLRHRLAKLREISSLERRDLVRAQVELLRAWLRMRVLPKGKLIRPTEPRSGGDGDLGRLEQLATAIERASTHGVFTPTCLQRAVALERLIERLPDQERGGAVVRVGVLPKDGKLLAHAWIVVGETIVGDAPSKVARFVPLQDFTALDA